MPPSRIRFILAILSFLALIVIYNVAKHISITIVFLNIVFLFWWLGSGLISGILFSLLSAILFHEPFGNLGPFVLATYTISFLISSAIGYAYHIKMNRIEQDSRVKIEKLEGDTNELFSKLRQKVEETKAMKLKLSRLSSLREVIDRFSSTLDQNRIIQIIVDTSNEVIEKSDRVLLYIVDTANQELKLMHSRRAKNLATVKVKKGDIFDRWVLRRREPLFVTDAHNDFRFFIEKDSGIDFNSLISAPFVSEDKVLGILRMDSLNKDFYSQEDLRLLDIISDIGTVALQNTFLYERVEELAIRDNLTSLYVQRYFRDRLKKEVERAHRSASTFSILILDIDDFKAYNDRYGHMSGDLVLKHIAGLLNSKIEPGDIAARYGGEEFALILLKKDKKSALSVANQILDEIKSRPLVLRRIPTNLTISIGLGSFPEDGKFEEDLIKCADRNLYMAKQKGKDRVCSK